MIKQTCLEQDEVHIAIAEIIGNGLTPELEYLCNFRTDLIELRNELEKELIKLGGTSKSYHEYLK